MIRNEFEQNNQDFPTGLDEQIVDGIRRVVGRNVAFHHAIIWRKIQNFPEGIVIEPLYESFEDAEARLKTREEGIKNNLIKEGLTPEDAVQEAKSIYERDKDYLEIVELQIGQDYITLNSGWPIENTHTHDTK